MEKPLHVLLSVCLLGLASGCAAPRVDMDAEVDMLIAQLHKSPDENSIARAALVRMGPRAAQHLVQRLDIPAHRLRRGGDALESARILRVLRELALPVALPACKRILLDLYIRPDSNEGAAVLNEAIGCVYALFPQKEARDIYYRFITGDPRQYRKEEMDIQHWGTGSNMDRLAVDVLTGFSLMVAAGDQRVQTALTSFLANISGGALQQMYFHQLDDNGFSVTERKTARESGEPGRLVVPGASQPSP